MKEHAELSQTTFREHERAYESFMHNYAACKDWKNNEINYRVFDEYMFNFSSAELKKQDVQFNVSDYFKRKIFPKRFFIHLKGSIKDKFIEKIAKILNVPI